MSAPTEQRIPWMSYLGLGSAKPEPGAPQRLEPLAAATTETAFPPAAVTEAMAAGALRDARAAWQDRLWGPGFLLPGGLSEAQRLSGLLPLSSATTVLQLGSDAGGLAATLAQGRGAWVAAQQDDDHLRERAKRHLRTLGKRVSVSPWDPASPAFRMGYHHHALMVEGMQRAAPARLLPAIAEALQAAGQLVMLEMVLLAEPSGPDATYLTRWMEVEGRWAPPPSEPAVSRALAAAGFRVHVMEDCGPRHATASVEAWGRVLGDLRDSGRPGQIASRALLAEIEPWLLRQRLMEGGYLGLRRWHASRVR